MRLDPVISCLFSSFYPVHPWNLTWNLKRSPWKRRFLLETIIFRFHVKFRGSIHCLWTPPNPATVVLQPATAMQSHMHWYLHWRKQPQWFQQGTVARAILYFTYGPGSFLHMRRQEARIMIQLNIGDTINKYHKSKKIHAFKFLKPSIFEKRSMENKWKYK